MTANRIQEVRPIEAPAPIMAEARTNCAERLIVRGHADEAERFALGERDGAWAFRHEVARLLALGGGV